MNTNRAVVRWLVLSIVILSFLAASSIGSFAQIGVGISVRVGPPALPIYAQPICPGPGYMWTPGYWGWNDGAGYYWVPGTWVVAPVGMLWTPGYWGWGGGFYAWHAGYWGPHVGFYGGINYGFGYGGVGFVGGEWRGGGFYYNRYVTNVSVTSVTHVYNRSVALNNTTTSFNGGTGGVVARPTAQEETAAHEPHTAPLTEQTQHETLASQNRENFASVNQGRPAVAATAKAGDFSSRSAVSSRAAGGEYHAPAMSPKEARVGTPGNSASGNKANSSDGFRSFAPPSKRASSTGASANSNESRPQTSSQNSSHQQSSANHSASQPKQGGKQNPHKANQNKHPNAPKEDHHKGR